MLVWMKRYWPLLLLLTLQFAFILRPGLDIAFSALFYDPVDGFLLRDSIAARLVESTSSLLGPALLPLLAWLLLASLYWRRKGEVLLRRKLWFLFVVVALAPMMAASLLQANSGRAHPQDIQAFAGSQQFTPAFQSGNQCSTHCSFISRAATLGFALIALAWTLAQRHWIVIGLCVGATVGLVQVAAGTHFVSDVVFGFWPVYGACLVAGWLLLGTHRIDMARR
ncbi:MAG: phosphatase PAP2 family protein [Gammaproteobacteria bacterium]|nr:phosphatase PAP2 family protein [Gammaproteobacteria bacterium]